MAISNMQQPLQIQGGLGSLRDPRQNYGLGKLVKKAVRGIKKVAKSPLGKMALLAGGAYFAPALWGAGKGLAGWKTGLGALTSKFGAAKMPAMLTRGMGGTPAGGGGFWTKGLGRFLNPWSGAFGEAGKFSGKHAFGLASGASMLAPLLFGGDDEEEESIDMLDPAEIKRRAIAHYSVPDAGLNFMPGKQFVQPNFYTAASGGRVGLLNGGGAGDEQLQQMLMAEFVKYKNQGGTLTFKQFVQAIMQAQQQQQGGGMEQPQEVAMAADGGRIGFQDGGAWSPGVGRTDEGYLSDHTTVTGDEGPTENIVDSNQIIKDLNPALNEIRTDVQDMYLKDLITTKNTTTDEDELSDLYATAEHGSPYTFMEDQLLINQGYKPSEVAGWKNREGEKLIKTLQLAKGGRAGALNGGFMDDDEDEYNYNPYKAMDMYKRRRKQDGGIMETEVAEEMIDLGGKEKDYRETGGFVDLGGKERADDVPARLSKNEFVFTADAVRAAGGGDIDAGSEVMQNMMDNLEAGGEISEESQGLEGAQAMYDQQQMLESRVI